MHGPLIRIAYLVAMMLLISCDQKKQPSEAMVAPSSSAPVESKGRPTKPVKIVIDWQPSGEYYGFFFAKSQGRYSSAGYDVEIVYGKGAPAVAAEVGTGAAMLGTTTSDNLLRWVAKGGSFSSARPLLAFNPAVVVSLESSKINKIDDLRGKTLGTNPESSVYTQFLRAVQRPSVQAMGAKEDPTIGWSGIPQLRGKSVDAILGYTTNIVVDLKLAGDRVHEIFLGEYGIKSYGLVLVATGDEYLSRGGLTRSDVKQIADITAKSYADGSEPRNLDLTISAIRAADPQLDARKLAAAIEKIRDLNSRIHYPLGTIDEWVESADVPRSVREKALSLYR